MARLCCTTWGGCARKLREDIPGEKVAWSCLGALLDRTDFIVGTGECFGFFVDFLGCVLVGDCVWAILGMLYGLKEEF